MSMRNWSADGFGVSSEAFRGVTDEQKEAFWKKYLPRTYKTTEEVGMSVEDIESIDGYLGWLPHFADAITINEEDFSVDYYCNDDGEEIIIYVDRQPWEMSDRVRAMSADDMRKVFAKYLKEFNISDEVVERQSIEMWG